MADEKELNEEEQEMTVTLTLDDDTEVECVVLTGPMGQPSATRPWFTGPRKGMNGARIYLPVYRSRPWRTRK